jgi:[ribosomal protein S5]-alanine N-acetyltransferase
MLNFNFSSFPILETNQSLLRRIDINDINDIFELRSNPETMKYVPRPLVKTLEEAKEHYELIDDKLKNNEAINWAITIKGNNKFIGIIGLFKLRPEHFRAEIGYMLSPDYKNKGIATEAVNSVLNFGFEELKLHSIEAIIDQYNLASEKVLLKNGFVKEAHLKENEFYNGQFIDTVIYSLLKKDHKNLINLEI